jgi:hypothetical protein
VQKVDSKFSFFQAPILAFFSGDLYRDVAANWKGSGALYIFLLSSGAWVVGCLAYFSPLVDMVNNKDLNAFLAQFPKMTLKEGKLAIDKKSPFAIKDPNSGTVMMLLAPDRTNTDMTETDPPFVMTQLGIIQRDDEKYQNASETTGNSSAVPGKYLSLPTGETFTFDKISPLVPLFEMDGPGIVASLHQAVIIFPIAVLALGWPFVFMGHLIQILIYGGIAMLIANAMQKKVEFEEGMRLAAIAITPAVMLSAIAAIANVLMKNYAQPNPLPLLSIPLALIYLVVIMRSLPAQEVSAPEATH